MNPRRITDHNSNNGRHDALKELAGRILGLSYSDMKEFAHRFITTDKVIDMDDFADRMVDVARGIIDGERP